MPGLLKNYGSIIMLSIAIIGSGAILMAISHKVYKVQNNINKMDRAIIRETWEIRSLKAELAYLTRPERLEQISAAVANGENAKSVIISQIAPVSFDVKNEENDSLILIPNKKPVFKISEMHYKKNETKTDFSSLLHTLEDVR